MSRTRIFLGFVDFFIVSFASLTRLEAFDIYRTFERGGSGKSLFVRVCMVVKSNLP